MSLLDKLKGKKAEPKLVPPEKQCGFKSAHGNMTCVLKKGHKGEWHDGGKGLKFK